VPGAPLSSPTRGFWRTVPLLASVPLAGLLAWGFVEALAPAGGGPVPPAPVVAPATRKPGEFLAVAMGDSLTRGTGAAAGSGYVDDVGNALRTRKSGFRLENIAIVGLETSGLRELLAHPEARALVASADAIFLSIGGNDLSHAVGRGASESPLVVLGRARRTFETNLDAILGELRARNPTAPIVYLLLYNPFGGQELGAAGSDVIVDWNASAAKIALAHGARAVPTFDIFEGHGDRLARDKFHPNEEGYRLIAERVKEVL
jgi:lysophospholipase L1-like esterase